MVLDDADLIPTLCFDCSSLADLVEEYMFFDGSAAVPALRAAVRLACTADDGGSRLPSMQRVSDPMEWINASAI